MPIPFVLMAAPFVAGAIQSGVANRKANKMQGEVQAAQGRVNELLEQRPDVIDKSEDIRGLKSMVSNPYANLGVATQAAEMQAEQTDIALANTLDAMMTTGAGAGGATALAQAAAQSKRGISASIESQEAANNKLRAEGQAAAQQQLMNIESSAISEEIAAFGRQDVRDQAAIDRAFGESDFLRSRQMQLQDAGDAAMMAGITGSINVASQLAGDGGLGGGSRSNTGGNTGFGSYSDYLSNPDQYNVGFGAGGGVLSESEFLKYTQ